MKFETKYKLLLWKKYFDTGYSLTSQFKYGFIAVAAAWQNTFWVTSLGVLYIILCFPLGYYFYKFKWIEAEAEVGNKFNRFQREVRRYIKKKPLNKKTAHN